MNSRLGFLLITLFVFIASCTNRQPIKEEMWVIASSGLRMRESPNLESKKIVTIPFASKVKILSRDGAQQEIHGIRGNWLEVDWNEKRGWVFDGYLRSFNPESLRKKASEHYRALIRKEMDSPEQFFQAYLPRSSNQTAKDIEIVSALGNLFLIKHWYVAETTPDDQRFLAIWHHNSGKWKELDYRLLDAQLQFIDEDNKPDAISNSGCCYSNYTEVILNPEERNTRIQNYLFGQVEIKATGRCNQTKLIFTSNQDGSQDIYSFDCLKNDFFNSSGQTPPDSR